MALIHPFGFYVFRRPCLSVEEVFDLLNSTKDEGALEAQLQRHFRQPVLQEAICLASPPVFGLLQAWLNGEPVPKKEKFVRTLLKYFLRAGTRCTPFGMFAGCTSVGYDSAGTAIRMRSSDPYSCSTRLDTRYTARIGEYFDQQPALRRQMRYYPNQSLYRIGNKFHYTYYLTRNEVRAYSICSVDASPYLERVLVAAEGGTTVGQLAVALAGAVEISLPDAEQFVFRLIDEQLLLSEIQPTLTGPDFLDVLIGRLGALEEPPAKLAALEQIQHLLRGNHRPLDQYGHIREIVQREFGLADQANVLQTDLFFNTAANSLGHRAMAGLTRILDKLLVLDQGVYNANLEDFKEKFYKRFEEQEVPLLEALDGEVGIPYGEMGRHNGGHFPLLESLHLAGNGGKTVLEWNYWKDFILRKYSEALLAQTAEIELTDDDLAELARYRPATDRALPGSLFAMGSMLASSAEALDRGDFLFVLNLITGPSAVNLLSRFCHGDDELLRNARHCVAAEEAEAPGALFAEIVHLPDAGAGNILKRPAFYRYEIPYLAQSSVAEPYQIPLSDLVVSVPRGQEVVLRSRRHNKRVFPRLTAAHNFKGGLGIYRFLCDLQYERRTVQVFWHWSILEKQNFLPRVRYRNVVLSRAAWRLEAGQLPGLTTSAAAGAAALRRAWQVRNMPRYVLITEDDNELLVDVEHAHCLELLREALLKKGTVTLREFLQTPDQCILRDARGGYTNEIIIPFKGAGPPVPGNRLAPAPAIPRKFMVGSEWLYLKLYTGEKFADVLLKKALKRMTDSLLAEGIINKWFFIRYVDPEHHLRIRFQGDPRRNFHGEVLTRVNAALDEYLQKGLIHRIQVDTYVREVERYGSQTMELSEELFFRDSQLVVHFLRRLNGDAHEQYRWLFALRRIDALLDDFGYSPGEKQRLLGGLRQRAFAQFAVDANTRKQLSDQYRRDLPRIARFLENTPGFSVVGRGANRLLNHPLVRSREVAREIAARTRAEQGDLDGLLSSYVHMFVNRLFISDQRSHELVLYHYLHKYHTARVEKRPELP